MLNVINGLRKTLVIGIDGADWAYLEQALPDCPVLKRLINTGTSGRLRSTMPPISPVAWSSFSTGKHPKKHGIFDWQVREIGGGLKRPVISKDRRGTPFWSYLNKAGIRTGVIGIPLTFPVEPLEGFMICGFDAPSQDNFYPANLREVLKKKFGERTDIIFKHSYHEGDERGYLAYWKDYIGSLTDAAIYLTDFFEIDCLVINYMAVDHLNHSAERLESVLEAFVYMDRAVDSFTKAFPESNVIILSDHGAKRVDGGFLICELLHEVGLLKYKSDGIDPFRHMELLVRFLQGKARLSGFFEKALRGALFYTLKALPKPVVRNFWRRIYSWDEKIFHLFWNIDQEDSVVDLSSGCAIQFYLKENNGVMQGDRQGAIDLLKDSLSKIKDPVSGEKLFEGLYESRQVADGDFADLAPDLIADFGDAPFHACLGYPMSKISQVDGLFAYKDHRYYNLMMKGTHRLHGIYILSGPGFQKIGKGPDMDIFDIPGLALAANDVPVPKDYDADLYPELLTMAINNDRQDSLDSDDAGDSSKDQDTDSYEETMNRLRSLGYVG